LKDKINVKYKIGNPQHPLQQQQQNNSTQLQLQLALKLFTSATNFGSGLLVFEKALGNVF
jgi:hypothetical protein